MKIPFSTPSPWQHIDNVNWAADFPYAPMTAFRGWHDGDNFYIEFKVEEETTKAEQNVPGDPVYMDSCVECFIQPDPGDPHYYNLEWNAAGHMEMGWRTGRDDAVKAPLSVLESIKTFPSLGSEPFGEKAIPGPWTLKVAIPASALFKSGLKSWSGLECRMNFYKCGDGLKKMHFLSWSPVRTSAPNHHTPQFFAPVIFD